MAVRCAALAEALQVPHFPLQQTATEEGWQMVPPPHCLHCACRHWQHSRCHLVLLVLPATPLCVLVPPLPYELLMPLACFVCWLSVHHMLRLPREKKAQMTAPLQQQVGT